MYLLRVTKLFSEQSLALQKDETSESIALHILDPIVASNKVASNKDLVSGVIQMYRWVVKITDEISSYTDDKKNHLLKLATLLEESIYRGAQQSAPADSANAPPLS